MKKKLLAYVCMIACIFGLTACGEGGELTEFEQKKVNQARDLSGEFIIIFAEGPLQDVNLPFAMEDLETNEEIEYVFEQYYRVLVDGNAVVTGVQSFDSALETIGNITKIEIDKAVVKVDGKQIIVEVPVTGEKQNAVAEVIFSNDLFMRLESAALNPVSSLGQLMAKAALNTLVGMFTVFAVLILISCIISCFRFIGKAQDAAAKRKEAKAAGKSEEADDTTAQIAVQEAAVDEADDLELVAVITAAIAASEGASSADGFVVRSIIRR